MNTQSGLTLRGGDAKSDLAILPAVDETGKKKAGLDIGNLYDTNGFTTIPDNKTVEIGPDGKLRLKSTGGVGPSTTLWINTNGDSAPADGEPFLPNDSEIDTDIYWSGYLFDRGGFFVSGGSPSVVTWSVGSFLSHIPVPVKGMYAIDLSMLSYGINNHGHGAFSIYKNNTLLVRAHRSNDISNGVDRLWNNRGYVSAAAGNDAFSIATVVSMEPASDDFIRVSYRQKWRQGTSIEGIFSPGVDPDNFGGGIPTLPVCPTWGPVPPTDPNDSSLVVYPSLSLYGVLSIYQVA